MFSGKGRVGAGIASTIGGMIDPVQHRHLAERERIDPLQTGEVVTILGRIGAALMVGVDAADAAEVVPGGMGVELVTAKLGLSLQDTDAGQRHRGDDGPPSPTERAVTAAPQ